MTKKFKVVAYDQYDSTLKEELVYAETKAEAMEEFARRHAKYVDQVRLQKILAFEQR